MKFDFKLDRLDKFDPAFAEDAESKLRAMVNHLHEYADDKRPRKLTLTFNMKPHSNASGQLCEVDVECEAKVVLPTSRSMTRRMMPGRNEDTLVFQHLDPKNPRQMSIDEIEDEKEKREDGVVPMKSGTDA